MKQIDVSSLKIDPKELKLRLLGANDSETLLKSAEIEKVIREVADCKYDFRETSVKVKESNVIFDFCELQSKDLSRNLKDCKSAFVVAVTLGLDVDRLLRRESVKSATDLLFADAVASALVEALCDKVQELLPTDTKSRFSPGYGDLPLSLQKPILNFLKTDGITLTETNLMIPTKTVTFIAGRKQ